MVSDPVIEARNLSRSFDGHLVLDQVSFSIQSGEIFGFLGPNGAGKTTTMRLLLGLIRPDRGEATVFGVSLAEHDRERRRVGVLLEQNGMTDRLSAERNLRYYAGLYSVPNPAQRVEEVLSLVGLLDRRSDLVGTFSTGMRRSLGLARAILHHPAVLFLDEPTSGLDPGAQQRVRELIRTLSVEESMTVFLNSHHLDEVERVCSRVAILQDQRIRAIDTVEGIRRGHQQRVFLIVLSRREQTVAAVEVLRTCPGVVEARLEEDGMMHVTLQGTSGSAGLLGCLVHAGIQVEEGYFKRESLEDAYLAVTGGDKT
ncbi:ABC transporter ATP-binding protein [Methanosphaerula palustris]|uniref:ABC transporter related n=1 Tax=Methanosphaerula palustris (strain ATCC BAA-1556 / DSM 19958 / E1-9c) TaxID=521011 RepID=B8GFT5_METPE|nr:ABC transporter ATP-binding protein [Methanosphaerula palustris]ACL17968.1 ABC transporter related [Methanosphaerula palustris E1-9c]